MNETIFNNIKRIALAQEISQKLKKNFGLTPVSLKGLSLILYFPDYIPRRDMTDIDFLLPENAPELEEIAKAVGMGIIPRDPQTLTDGKGNFVDFHFSIWHLAKSENRKIFESCKSISGVSVLPKDILLLDIIAHFLFCHASKVFLEKFLNDTEILISSLSEQEISNVRKRLLENRWVSPLNTFLGNKKNKLWKDILPEKSRNQLYCFLLNYNRTEGKGHITKFLFCPTRAKVFYIKNIFFPGKSFLKLRYDHNSSYFYRLLKLFLDFTKFLFNFCCSIIIPSSGSPQIPERKFEQEFT